MHAAGRRIGRHHDNDGDNDDVALGGGGARCRAYSHMGVDSAVGRRCSTSTDRQVLLGMIYEVAALLEVRMQEKNWVRIFVKSFPFRLVRKCLSL
jgi:hypothetical protein